MPVPASVNKKRPGPGKAGAENVAPIDVWLQPVAERGRTLRGENRGQGTLKFFWKIFL